MSTTIAIQFLRQPLRQSMRQPLDEPLAPVLPLRTPRRLDHADGAEGVRRDVPAWSGVRLTRRGRLVVFLTSLLLVLAAFVLLSSGSVATLDAGTPPPTEVVRVAEGETLWGIASQRAAHGGEVREVMREIERLNALESGMLQAGQKLRVPLAD